MTTKNPSNLKAKMRKLINYLLLIFLLMFFLSLLRSVAKIKSVNTTILEKEAKVNKLKQDNLELEKKISEMKSPEYIESQIRNNLGLVKEGEIVVVLPDEQTLRLLAPPEIEEEDFLPDPNWKKWLKIFR